MSASHYYFNKSVNLLKGTIMKKIIIVTLLSLITFGSKSFAQENKTASTVSASENYGRTLNLGVGLGYYGYVGHNIPVVHADFEFQVARNFTLAPSITFYSYQNYYYWGNPHSAYRNYSYTQTVVPIGVKATYYFDQLLHAGPKWDFYLAGSLGFIVRSTVWENGYYGETVANQSTSALYVDVHAGAEYHMSNHLGLFLDLSSGVSTLGLGIHF